MELQGTLTLESNFGIDPLKDSENLQRKRDCLYKRQVPSFEDIFTNVASSDGQYFCDSISIFENITKRLSDLI